MKSEHNQNQVNLFQLWPVFGEFILPPFWPARCFKKIASGVCSPCARINSHTKRKDWLQTLSWKWAGSRRRLSLTIKIVVGIYEKCLQAEQQIRFNSLLADVLNRKCCEHARGYKVKMNNDKNLLLILTKRLTVAARLFFTSFPLQW